MAKAAKPSYQHTGRAVKLAPKRNENDQKTRKRMIPKTGKYTARSSQKYGEERPDQTMTPERWNTILTALAHGKNRAEAAVEAGITVQAIDAYLISNVAAYKQLRDAIQIHNRRNWPSELIEQIFLDLASGLTMKRACMKNGVADRYHTLMNLIHNDKQIRAMYDNARELWAENFLDDTIDIADDSENDRLENGRINHEVVNRSKLRIETRWRAMGAMVKKRFGDHKHVEHEGNITMNHVALLTGARKRLEKARPGAVQHKKQVTIDNETGEVEQK